MQKNYSFTNLKAYMRGGVKEDEIGRLDLAYETTISRLDYCFSHVKNKYYHNDGETFFNPLHVAQWTMFLYTIARELNGYGYIELCDKIYGISKMISSADIFYEVKMPDIWFFDHPQGSVMGRAVYGDYFSFSQGCTVGNNKGVYPHIGKHVSMMSGSKILGNCCIGDYVIFSANSFIMDINIPSNSIVFGVHPNVIIHPITTEKFYGLTGSMFKPEKENT